MELYLDTADVAAVRRWSRILPLAGVTTNPSITAAGGMPLAELLPALREVLGPKARLFAQVMAKTETEMVREAFALRELDRDLVIKIPVCEGAGGHQDPDCQRGADPGHGGLYPAAGLAGGGGGGPNTWRPTSTGWMPRGRWHRHRTGAATAAGAACAAQQVLAASFRTRARRLTACWRVASPSRCRSMWPNSC